MNINFEKLNIEINNLDPIQWRNELKKELENQSDRAIAIICGSILDVQLKELLQNFLIEDKNVTKDLFDGNNPLQSFSSKIKMAYYLGLISHNEYNNLNLIRKIRNEFAHQLFGLSFESSTSISARCNNFDIPKNMYLPERIPIKTMDNLLPKLNLDPFAEDKSPKNRFVQTFNYLSINLIHRNFEMLGLRRTKYEHKLTTAEMFRKQKEKINKSLEEFNKLQEQQKLNEKLSNDKENESSEILKYLQTILHYYDYIAEVLENSYSE